MKKEEISSIDQYAMRLEMEIKLQMEFVLKQLLISKLGLELY